MPIRPSNTVHIIGKLFADYEAGTPTAMELAALHDELSRLERKWEMLWAAGTNKRKPSDREKLNAWFERLVRLIDRLTRTAQLAPDEIALLASVRTKCAERTGASR